LAYLSNDVVNRANIHTGLQTAAAASGGAFVFAFLLRQGFTLAQALALIAAIMAGRFCLRPMLVPLGVRFGIKPLLLTGTLVGAALYPILSLIHGVSPVVIGCAFVAAVSDVFYWTSYHAYFSSIGDQEHRGHQIGAREALGAALCVIAPILGAWSLVNYGATWTFVAVGVLQASAALPLINAPNVLVAREAKLPPASVRLGAVLYVTHGWFDACSVFVWNLALFVSLGEDYAAYGGALALAGFGAVVGALLLGRQVDKGGGARAASLAFGFAGAVTLFKAASLSSPWLAVAANVAGGVVMPLLMPPLAGAVYNLAKSSSCPLRFHVASEGAWDVGCAGGCLISAGLAAMGAPLGLAVLLGLPPLVIGAVALRGYFAQLSPATAA
jgi:DHA1 family inner membrane transport protein